MPLSTEFRVLDVDEITYYIRDVFDSDPVFADVWIRGEISNAHRSAAGHWYFVLKSESSQIKCVLFRGDAVLVDHKPNDGDAVIAHGRISTYPAHGQYQLYVDHILPEGDGQLQLEFERLRRRLEEDGFFDESRKRALPPRPECVAVVTSATGSVWHDIKDVLGRRYPLCELVLCPAMVQGDGCPASVVAAIQSVINDGRADVVIVARGGGSIEDLWGFNDEQVVRAVYRCPVPVVSAIGHETDVTLTDLVADLRAPTPSAAAEQVAPHIREYYQDLKSRADALSSGISNHLSHERHTMDQCLRRLSRYDPHWSLQQERMRLDRLADGFGRAIDLQIYRERTKVQACEGQVALLNPARLVASGYAMLSDPDTGSRVRGAADLSPGTPVKLEFHDGEAMANVNEVTPRRANEVGND